MYAIALAKTFDESHANSHTRSIESVEDYFKEAIALAKSSGASDDQVDALFLASANTFLLQLWHQICATNNEAQLNVIQQQLDKLIEIASANAPDKTIGTITFASCRIKAIGYNRCRHWTAMVKSLNMALTSGSQEQGKREAGLADALVLVCEAYSSLGRQEDSLRSAKLAVSMAHEMLETEKKSFEQTGDGSEPTKGLVRACGPMLPLPVALAISYHSLANQLQIAGFQQLCGDWHQRALNVALKYDIEETVVDMLQRAMTQASITLPVNRSPTAHHKTAVAGEVAQSSPVPVHSNLVVTTARGNESLVPTFGGSKSMDDVELAKQLNSMNYRQQTIHDRNRGTERVNNWSLGQPQISQQQNAEQAAKGDGDSSSISDDNEPRNQPRDEYKYKGSAPREYANPVTSATNINSGFNDSFVETVDLRRKHPPYGNGERPRSALPRLIHDTLIIDRDNNFQNNHDGDSLTMESGMASMQRHSSAAHLNHIPSADLDIVGTYIGQGIDQSTAGLKPVRVQSALSRLGAAYSNPPQRPDASRDKLVTNVNVNVRGGDVLPQGSGVFGGPSGDYSAELFPPLPSTIPHSSNAVGNGGNAFHTSNSSQAFVQSRALLSNLVGEGSQLPQYNNQLPVGYASVSNWFTSRPNEQFGQSFSNYGTSGVYGISTTAYPQNDAFLYGEPRDESILNDSVARSNHRPEPPTSPYPVLLMPRIIQQQPFANLQQPVNGGKLSPVRDVENPNPVPAQPRAQAIVQLSSNPVPTAKQFKGTGKSPVKATKRVQKKAAPRSEPSNAIVGTSTSFAQDSVALSVALTWERIVGDGSKSALHVKALSGALDQEQSLGVNIENSLGPASTDVQEPVNAAASSRVESEMSTRLRDLILKARSEERELLLNEIVSEEKIKRLKLFHIGMKVRRFLCAPSDIPNQQSIVVEDNPAPSEETLFRIGTIANIRPHLLSFDIKYDDSQSPTSESFVSMYSVLPLLSRESATNISAENIIIDGLKAGGVRGRDAISHVNSVPKSVHEVDHRNNTAGLQQPKIVGRSIVSSDRSKGLASMTSVIRGKIESLHSNGSFDVVFGNGSKEKGVMADNIRTVKLSQIKLNELYIRSLVASEDENGQSNRVAGPGSIIAGLDLKKAYPWVNSEENSRQLRADATYDMHRFMTLARQRVVEKKREVEYNKLNSDFGKVKRIQALARGYCTRRKLPGITRQLNRFRQLMQKERDLAKKQAELENQLLLAQRKIASLAVINDASNYKQSGGHMNAVESRPIQVETKPISLANTPQQTPIILQYSPQRISVQPVVHANQQTVSPAVSVENVKPPSVLQQQLENQQKELKCKEDTILKRAAELNEERRLLDDARKQLAVMEEARKKEQRELELKESSIEQQRKQLEELTAQLEQQKRNDNQAIALREAAAAEAANNMAIRESANNSALRLELVALKDQLRAERELLKADSLNVQSQRDALRKEWNDCAKEKMELTRIAESNKLDYIHLEQLKQQVELIQQQQQQQLLQLKLSAAQSSSERAVTSISLAEDHLSIYSNEDKTLADQESEMEAKILGELGKLQEKIRDYGAAITNSQGSLDGRMVEQLLESNRQREEKLQIAVQEQHDNEIELQKQLQVEHDRLQDVLKRVVDSGVDDPELLQYLDESIIGTGVVSGGSVLSVVSASSAKDIIMQVQLEYPGEDVEDCLPEIGESGFDRGIDSPCSEVLTSPNDRSVDHGGSFHSRSSVRIHEESVKEDSLLRSLQPSYSKSQSFDEAVELGEPVDIMSMVSSLPSCQYLSLSIISTNTSDIVDVWAPNSDHVRVSHSRLLSDAHEKYSDSNRTCVSSKVVCVTSPLSNFLTGDSCAKIDEQFIAESVVVSIRRRRKSLPSGLTDDVKPRSHEDLLDQPIATTSIPIHSLLLMAGSQIAEPMKYTLTRVNTANNSEPAHLAPIEVYIRANFIDLKTATNLFVALWEVHLSWSVQSLLIHAAAAEQMGDIVVENVDALMMQQKAIANWKEHRVLTGNGEIIGAQGTEVVVNPTPRSSQLVDELPGGQYMDYLDGKIGEVLEFGAPISLISRDCLLVSERINDNKKIFVHGVRRAGDEGVIWDLSIQPGDELVSLNGTIFEGEPLEALHGWIRRHTAHLNAASNSLTLPITVKIRRYVGHNLAAYKQDMIGIISSSRALFDKFAASANDVELALEQMLRAMDLSSLVIRNRNTKHHTHSQPQTRALLAVETDCISELSTEIQTVAASVYSFLAEVPTRHLAPLPDPTVRRSLPSDQGAEYQPLVLSRQGTGQTLGSAGEILEIFGCNPLPGMQLALPADDVAEDSVEDLLAPTNYSKSQQNSPRHMPIASTAPKSPQSNADGDEVVEEIFPIETTPLLPIEDMWVVVQASLSRAYTRFMMDIVCGDSDNEWRIADDAIVNQVMSVCRAVMEVVLQHIERFDWNIWWQKRDYWVELTAMNEFSAVLLRIDRAMFQPDSTADRDPTVLPALISSKNGISGLSSSNDVPNLIEDAAVGEVFDTTALCVLATAAMRSQPPEAEDPYIGDMGFDLECEPSVDQIPSVHSLSHSVMSRNVIENISMITDNSDELVGKAASVEEGGGELLELLFSFYKQTIDVHVRWCIHKLFITAFLERHASEYLARTAASKSASNDVLDVDLAASMLSPNTVSKLLGLNSPEHDILPEIESLSGNGGGSVAESGRVPKDRRIMLESVKRKADSFNNDAIQPATTTPVISPRVGVSGSVDFEDSCSLMSTGALDASENTLTRQVHAGQIFYNKFLSTLTEMKVAFMDNFCSAEDDNPANNEAAVYIETVTVFLFSSVGNIFDRLYKNARRVYLQRNLSRLDITDSSAVLRMCQQQLDIWVQCKSGLHSLLAEFLSRFLDDLGSSVANQLRNLTSTLHTNLEAFGQDLFQSMQQEIDQFEWVEIWRRRVLCRERGLIDLVQTHINQALSDMLTAKPIVSTFSASASVQESENSRK